MELKSLQDWVLVKQFKTVPNVVDVSVFGGPTREYQVRVDPAKLVSYGLSIGQVEQQLANNNVNAGGSFIEAGMQQINVRAVGLVRTAPTLRIRSSRPRTAHRCGSKTSPSSSQGPKIRLGQFGRAIHRSDGKIMDNEDVVSGIVLMRKGADFDSTHRGRPQEGARAERKDSAPGREGRSLQRSRGSRPLHDPHRPAKPYRRLHSRNGRAAPLSRKYSGCAHRRADDSIFVIVRVHLSRPETDPGKSVVPGRARLRHGGGRGGRDGRKHRSPLGSPGSELHP